MSGSAVEHLSGDLRSRRRSQFEAWIGALGRLARAGLEPRCVIDVGAGAGDWSRAVHSVFPLAELHLFEAQADREPSFRSALNRLLATPGISAHVHPLTPGEPADAGSPSGQTLDQFWAAARLPAVSLVRIESRRATLGILRGAPRILEDAQAVVTKLWTWPVHGPETPLASEVAQWLLLHDFYLAELGRQHTDDSGHLIAFDAIFTRSQLRPWQEPA